MTAEIDESLVTQAVSGDHKALSQLLDRFAPRIQREVAGQISQQWRSALDAEDIMQVTFLEAFPAGGSPAGLRFAGFRRLADAHCQEQLAGCDSRIAG